MSTSISRATGRRTKLSDAETPPIKSVHCAIYTRKSTDEGLDQDFNSLDAQREAGENFIRSQAGEGWVCLAARYDDGGYSGGDMDRPALQRLLRDIEAGEIDTVVVYKVDRLSRSLLDFTKMMEVFDRNQVSFVSVTQQLNTTTSMGRLTLNVLLSFAQFEREIISERTRDKMAAARRKGKYVGGAPVLGYDIDRAVSRLVVNAREAAQVQQIFDAYLKCGSMLPTIQELDRLGLTTKRWTTKAGKLRGGRRFDKNYLYLLLTNRIYIGQIAYRDEVYPAEHPGIIEPEVFQQVQDRLNANRRHGGAESRNKHGALLRGLLRCGPCGCAMIHSHSTKDGKKRYRYYVCTQAQKRGWRTCPSKSVPAAEMERYVVDEIRAIGRDPGLIAETIQQVQSQVAEQLAALESERQAIQRDMASKDSQLRRLTAIVPVDVGRLAELQEQMRADEQRLTRIREESMRLRSEQIQPDDVEAALAEFDRLWTELSPREQSHVLQLLIESVAYDGAEGTIAVSFRSTGIHSLNQQVEEIQTCQD